jgi:glycosyltransferase involved in cell wall biosynthesis
VWPVSSPKPKVIASAKFDLIHSHHFYSPFNYSLNFAKSSGAFHISTFYRLFPEYESKNSGLSLTSGYEKSVRNMREIANSTNRVIALSNAHKQYLQDFGVNVPVDVAPVGIFTKDYASYPPQAIREKFRIPKERKILLSVLRLEPDANLEFLLRAFKIVWKAIDDVHLLIIGGGSKENELKEMIGRQPFRDYISLTGFLPKNQVNKIYGVADIFVYPKMLDPEPLCVLESLAAGTPVVAVNGFGINDFIKHNQEGLITKSEVEDFASGITELLRRDQLRLEFSIRSRSKAREFRASNLTRFLLELYNSALTGKSRRMF